MKYITKEVRIGIAGIAALCILVYGINYLKGINMFKPSSYFYVKFQNVNGLTKSSPVFADGFRVGIVRDLYYDYTQPTGEIPDWRHNPRRAEQRNDGKSCHHDAASREDAAQAGFHPRILKCHTSRPRHPCNLA